MEREEHLRIIGRCEGLVLNPSLSYLYLWNQVIKKTDYAIDRFEVVNSVVEMLDDSRDIARVDDYIGYIIHSKCHESIGRTTVY